jgi:hypothetical protein
VCPRGEAHKLSFQSANLTLLCPLLIIKVFVSSYDDKYICVRFSILCRCRGGCMWTSRQEGVNTDTS